MAGALHGYRVVDFGRYISGPFCAALLGDMGADVIRVEPLEGADDRRVMPIGEDNAGGGALHYHVNRTKRSLAIDMAHPRARPVINRLIASADVVVANAPPRALEKLGLDYPTLSAIRSDIILTSVNAYGLSSPHANSIGFDGTGQALSGAMALTGTPDQPFRSAISYVDYATAMSAAVGTVAALLKRERTGTGEHVHSSLLGTALTMVNSMLIEEASGTRSRQPTGNRSPIAGPSDLFRTRDGWVMIQVIGQPMFARLAALIGRPDILNDARFADDQSRGENGEELSRITAAWTADKTTGQCLEEMRAARLPATPLLHPRETLKATEIVEGGFLNTLKTRDDIDVPLVGAPFEFLHHTASAMRPAPSLGEHSDIILREIGFDDAAIEDMRRTAVIACHARYPE